MTDAAEFEAHRSHLHALAYRMLGASSEADDVVQEAWIRWCAAEPEAVQHPRAWLSTVVTRLCLDQLKSARVRREAYVGPWLPEPVRTEDSVDGERVSMAFLLLLEALSPAERAAYLLHEAFDYTHAEVAEILGRDEAACRQLYHRARQHVIARRPRYAPSREAHARLLTGFLHAVSAGDLDGLKSMLSADATLHTDGGGKVHAARNVLRGADAIARFFLGLLKKSPPSPGVRFEIADLNGWPAMLWHEDDRVVLVMGLETDGALVHGVYFVLNPDKLTRLSSGDGARPP